MDTLARIRTTKLIFAAAATVVFGAAGCSPERTEVFGELDEGGESFATEMRGLYYVTDKIWAQRDIPVCWVTAGNETEKAWVKDALRGQRSWSSEGNVSFIGWGTCAAGDRGIRVTSGSAMETSYLGRGDSGLAEITLDFRAAPQNLYSVCVSNSLSREQCIKTVALHEFGHAIGYAHEHNRPDTDVAACTSAPQGSNGDDEFGEFDMLSIMAYCDFTTDLSGIDRRGTDRLYGQKYGGSNRLHSYNNDARADILCHDVVTGDKWIDFANSSGQFLGTDWERATNWCSHDTGRLFTGDFNGDNRGDMLCHDVVTGYKWTDHADIAGQFFGTDFERDAVWCSHENGLLLIGDFDGDGRDDMLCHDTANGRKWIDYAGPGGLFLGTDWSTTANWCGAANGRLFVGDFNGDQHDDLLCHDVVGGRKWIDYADEDGRFLGTDWERNTTWCSHDSGEVSIGDFNGDQHDDMLCHDTLTGRKWIDYASDAGRFLGTDWERNAAWCGHSAGRIFIGDVNGDGSDDLLCHDVSTGKKWVDFADAAGEFHGTDWSANAAGCVHDAGELH